MMNKYIVECHIDYEDYEVCFVKAFSGEEAALKAYRFLALKEQEELGKKYEFSEDSPCIEPTNEIQREEYIVGIRRMWFIIHPIKEVTWYE